MYLFFLALFIDQVLLETYFWRHFFFADHLSKEGDDQRQEAAEERHKAVQLDYHAEHRPAQQHRHDSAQEGRGSLQPIPLREKGESLVQSQTAGKS